ncbi:hypothetical protein NWF34_06030 [Gordonia sp. GONU]|uniref:hypothetical protein n=1 Tax=Gordonia sp. GONU TaxID=2972949 RepID=UPI0021AD0C4A|nr:hypothetical protein [Gordonia sp. GONU]MCR8896515.1 hypothetical protein [Gordonia sp. GONU]
MTDQTTNRLRAARILRAQLDDDSDTARSVLDEAYGADQENGLAGIISALVVAMIEQLAYATGGDLEAARKIVDLTLLDLSMGGGTDGA